MAPRLGTKAKAAALILLLGSAEAVRMTEEIQAARANQTVLPGAAGAVAEVGMKAVSVYAGGNCQFMPLFDVAHFMMETAPAAAAGAGMLAKPAVTTAVTAATSGAATTAVTMGTKAGLIGKMTGGVLGMATPIGIAFNVGMTAYQLWQLKQFLTKDPSQICLMIAAVTPPYDTSVCGVGGPGIKLPGGLVAPGLPGIPEPPAGLNGLSIPPGVAIAGVVVLFVGVGAFALWQRRLRERNFDKTFCPTNLWRTNPDLMNEDEQLPDVEREMDDEDEVMRGMPKCRGLRPRTAPISCDKEDVYCRMSVCRQACCNDKQCSMYQFELKDRTYTDEDGREQEIKDSFYCYLGDAQRSFTPQQCDAWAGLAKIEVSHERKMGGGYTEDERLSKQIMGLKKLTIDGPPRKRRSESEMFYRMRVCQIACASNHECKFFQIEVGKDICWFGNKALDQYRTRHGAEDEKFFGGVLSVSAQDKQSCPENKKACPGKGRGALSRCVDSCAECDGFSAEGEDNKCVRSPGQAVCHPGNWVDSFNERALNKHQCTGLRHQKVVMDEDTDFNAHAVCREICCGEPDCVLYQVRRDVAKKEGLKKGDTVHCWLGMVYKNFHPLFKCEREVSEGWLIRQWVGGYLTERGCASGHSCLTTGECVNSCAAQCPGAPLEAEGQCREEDAPAEEEAASEDEGLVSLGGASEYYLHDGELSSQAQAAAADTLLMVAQNRKRLIAPTDLSEEACAALALGGRCAPKAGACECTYAEPKACDVWFSGPKQVRPVIDGKGMLLISGETCQCEASTCSFGLLDRVPKIKVSAADEMAVNV